MWQSITSDPEILEMVKGLPIECNDMGSLPQTRAYQISFPPEQKLFLENEIKVLLAKGVIVKTIHEPGEFMSPIS